MNPWQPRVHDFLFAANHLIVDIMTDKVSKAWAAIRIDHGTGLNHPVDKALSVFLGLFGDDHFGDDHFGDDHFGETRPTRLIPCAPGVAERQILVGEDLDDSKVKVFSAPRFKSVAMTDEAYTRHTSTPEEYFQGAFGMYKDGSDAVEVILTFNKQIAPYVRERRWRGFRRRN